MEKILLIDTTDNKKIKVGLKIHKKSVYLDSEPTELKSQVILNLIDKILKANKIQIKDITQVLINLGPGSFTGIRVGVSVANTLGTFLKIPINNKKVGDLVEPLYNN